MCPTSPTTPIIIQVEQLQLQIQAGVKLKWNGEWGEWGNGEGGGQVRGIGMFPCNTTLYVFLFTFHMKK